MRYQCLEFRNHPETIAREPPPKFPSDVSIFDDLMDWYLLGSYEKRFYRMQHHNSLNGKTSYSQIS